MKRKGWPAEAKDMRSIVAIHNGVNERAWHQILRYEARPLRRRRYSSRMSKGRCKIDSIIWCRPTYCPHWHRWRLKGNNLQTEL